MRVSLAGIVIILGTLATATLAIVAAMWMNRRRRDEELRSHGNPLLVMPGTSNGPLVMPSGPRATPPGRPAVTYARATISEPFGGEVSVPLSGPINAIVDPVTATTGPFAPGTQAPEVIMGHSLRFHRPAEGTLQFLPGFLEVVGGPDAGHEVRFVQPGPGENPDITFGRREGPAYRHVQLLEPTVSRTHAKLTPEGERWRLTNLSRTNPVVVNGIALDGVNSMHLLQDSDLVEMGALVFRFRIR